jgi:(p)ppGpp synthase/HD superfamily hydrolase
MGETVLTERFREAMDLAFDLHREQRRKMRGDPYFSHLMGVAALVLEHGGDEDQAIAALLHDTVEDQGYSLDSIRERFGDRVASMVDYATERHAKGGNYRERKTDYTDRMRDEASADALLVIAADKLHNARSTHGNLLDGYDAMSTFPSFDWYYRALMGVFDARWTDLSDGTRDLVARLRETLAGISAERVA